MIKRILPLAVVVCLLVAYLAVSASAAVIDPSTYGDYVVDGNNIIYYLNNQFDLFWWRRLHDGSLSNTGSGQSFSYSTQMRYVDNDEIYLFPFGYSGSKSNFIDLGAYPLGSEITFTAQFELSIPASTQDYSTQLFYYWHWYDGNGNQIGSFNSFILPIESGQGLRQYNLTDTFSCDDPNVRYFDLYFRWDFSGVSDEEDTVSVSVDVDTYGLSFGFPVDRLGQLIEQGKLTNEQLGKIDQALKDNGQKLDDVIKEQQGIRDDIDNAVNGEASPVRPDGSGEIDDFHNKEEELWGSVSGGTQQADQVVLGAGNVLRELAAPFLVVASICNILWTRDPFWDLLYVSLALGIVASILGLGVVAARSSSGKSKGGKK